jgi:hypothetical protein
MRKIKAISPVRVLLLLWASLNDVRTFSLSPASASLKAQMRQLVKLIPEFAAFVAAMSPDVTNVRKRAA